VSADMGQNRLNYVCYQRPPLPIKGSYLMNPLREEVFLVRESQRYEKIHPGYQYHHSLSEERFEGGKQSFRF